MEKYPFDKRYEVKSFDGGRYFIDCDEYIRTVAGAKPIYRLDGDELYTYGNNAKLMGYLEGNQVIGLDGNVFLTILGI
ncbi:hypothetical protein ACP3UV_22305 [Mixta calida]